MVTSNGLLSEAIAQDGTSYTDPQATLRALCTEQAGMPQEENSYKYSYPNCIYMEQELKF